MAGFMIWANCGRNSLIPVIVNTKKRSMTHKRIFVYFIEKRCRFDVNACLKNSNNNSYLWKFLCLLLNWNQTYIFLFYKQNDRTLTIWFISSRSRRLSTAIPFFQKKYLYSFFHFYFPSFSWLYYYFGRLADTVYDEQLISRAYYKIKEACTRQHVHFHKDQIGVDLGAAPGGYTLFPFLTF